MLLKRVLPVLKQLAIPAERAVTKALFLVAVVAVLLATLHPFNPFPRNGVTWLGTRGLRFQNAGMVVGNEPLRVGETQEPERYTLELLLRPATTESPYTNTILAIDTLAPSTDFLVRQWMDGLAISHEETAQDDETGKTGVYVPHVFRPGKAVLATISSGANGTSVYLDGALASSFPRFRISGADLSGRMVLGTSPAAYCPWSGDLLGIAVYAKEMTSADALRHDQEWKNSSAAPDLESAIARYSFTEASGSEVHNDVPAAPKLTIPARFTVPRKGMLLFPAEERKVNTTYTFDIVTNIAGFVPLGLIGCAYFSWKRTRWESILLITVLCGVLSFVIEVLQYYIPSRGSGITDVITNTLGAALGAMLLYDGTVRRVLERFGLIRASQSRPLCMAATAES